MKEKRIPDLLLAALTILLAALVIAQSLGIYRYGISADNLGDAGVRIADIYSREIVVAALAKIAWAFWAWLAALIISAVYRVIRPVSRRAEKISAETQLALLRLHKQTTPAMRAEAQKRRVAASLTALFGAICAVPAVMYLLDATHFESRDLEMVMGDMLWSVVPWVSAAFAGGFVWAQYRESSMRREAEAAKSAPACAVKTEITARPGLRRGLRLAMLAAAVALIVAGIVNGGMYDVLVKAINICTECIGLG